MFKEPELNTLLLLRFGIFQRTKAKGFSDSEIFKDSETVSSLKISKNYTTLGGNYTRMVTNG